MWLLLLLIFIAALPVFAAFLWFRFKGFHISPSWFLICLFIGAISLLFAAVVQYFIPYASMGGIKGLLLNIFARIALVEEGSRFLLMTILFRIAGSIGEKKPLSPHGSAFEPSPRPASMFPPKNSPLSLSGWGAATGLITGLGFALVESASYGAQDIHFALLRDFTSAPIHGACGARVGAAVISLKEDTGRSLRMFLTAVAIHGMYDMLVISPKIRFAAVVLAYSSLFTAMRMIRDK
jgi:RsiW-degrading membrane proteinase PrsW (M82 family)